MLFGKEKVFLKISAKAIEKSFSPIIGFNIKDKFGKIVFGANTYLSAKSSPLDLDVNEKFEGEFEFNIPILKEGKYTIDAMVATGTNDFHSFQDWKYDIVVFEMSKNKFCFGIIAFDDIKANINKS